MYLCSALVERRPRQQQYQRLCQHVPADIVPVRRCQDHLVIARPTGSVAISTWPVAAVRVTFSQTWEPQRPAIARTTATTSTCARHSTLPLLLPILWSSYESSHNFVIIAAAWMSCLYHIRMSSIHLCAGRPRCLSPSSITRHQWHVTILMERDYCTNRTNYS